MGAPRAIALCQCFTGALEFQAGHWVEAEAALGVGPSEEEVQAEIDRRRLNPTRLQLSLIVATPQKAKDAPANAEPTDKQWADAKAEIDDIKAELDGGGDFATLAEQRSDDPSKALKGLLGWVERTDGQYGEYFKELWDESVSEEYITQQAQNTAPPVLAPQFLKMLGL